MNIFREELRKIKTYPDSIKAVDCGINGVGFFPGAKGFWNFCTDDSFSDKPIMILGHDFGSERDYERSVERGEENLNALTWRNLLILLDEYGIDKKKCFFTNVLMGVRTIGGAEGANPAINNSDFLAVCIQFLFKQIEIQKPKLIVVIGLHAIRLISRLSNDLAYLNDIQTFAQLNEMSCSSRRNVSIKRNDNNTAVNVNFAFITHPVRWHINVANRIIGEYTGKEAERKLIAQFLPVDEDVPPKNADSSSFEDNIRSLFSLFQKGLKFSSGLGVHLLITDIDRNNCKEILLNSLSSQKWTQFDEKRHEIGSQDYNYVVINNIENPDDLYTVLLQHNSKILVFDSDKIFASYHYTNLLAGAICSSPDSVKKWSVQYPDKHEFTFQGRCIIMTSRRFCELKKMEWMEYILRDTYKTKD